MSRLIDADKLEPDTEWSEYYDDFMSYSQSQIRDAEEVKAISLDKIKKAREEINELDGEYLTIYDGTNKLGSGKYAYIEDVLEILDKLIESEG